MEERKKTDFTAETSTFKQLKEIVISHDELTLCWDGHAARPSCVPPLGQGLLDLGTSDPQDPERKKREQKIDELTRNIVYGSHIKLLFSSSRVFSILIQFRFFMQHQVTTAVVSGHRTETYEKFPLKEKEQTCPHSHFHLSSFLFETPSEGSFLTLAATKNTEDTKRVTTLLPLHVNKIKLK